MELSFNGRYIHIHKITNNNNNQQKDDLNLLAYVLTFISRMVAKSPSNTDWPLSLLSLLLCSPPPMYLPTSMYPIIQ